MDLDVDIPRECGGATLGELKDINWYPGGISPDTNMYLRVHLY